MSVQSGQSHLSPSMLLNDDLLFVAVFLGCNSTGRVGLCFLWFYVQELQKAQPALTRSGSGFESSQKMGQELKVSSDRLGEARNRTCDHWFSRHRFIPYTRAAFK